MRHPPRLLLLLILTLNLSAAWAAGQSDKDVVLAADLWCPYNCKPDSDQPGYMVELAQKAFAEKGYRVKYINLPWSRTLSLVRAGKLDGAIGATRTNANQLTFGKQMLGIDHTVMAVRKGEAFVYSGPASLQHKVVGMIQDYSYDNNGAIDHFLAQRIRAKQGDVIKLANDGSIKQLLGMLQRKRIDLFFANENVLSLALKQTGKADRTDIIPTHEFDYVSIAFAPNPRGRLFSDWMDTAMSNYRRDGTLQKILARYGLQDWEQKTATPIQR